MLSIAVQAGIKLSCLLLLYSSSSFSSGFDVLQHLDKLRPTGWGSPVVIAQAKGVITGDAESLVVLYSYEIGPGKDRNHWQFLAVFHGSELTANAQVGGGPQKFQSLRVAQGVILLSGKKYGPDDPMCCPTISVEIGYILRNGVLMAKAYAT